MKPQLRARELLTVSRAQHVHVWRFLSARRFVCGLPERELLGRRTACEGARRIGRFRSAAILRNVMHEIGQLGA